MANPAIVLMTDPSRCNLGDMHHLVQALLEIQQMGQHAIPQAFCDHPEAAKGFLEAYTHAYPQLVLEDREIPTPDHLQSLISTGQIGALSHPPEPIPTGDLPGAAAPSAPNALNGFPIVVLTLGSSQALLDALQQSPTIRDSIRLIDVGHERADSPSVSIADAVAIRGPDGLPWEYPRSSGAGAELDDIAAAAKAEFVVALSDDQVSLDVVDVPSGARRAHDGEQDLLPAEPSLVTAKPAVAYVEERSAPVSSDDGRSGASPVESASQPVSSRSSDSAPVETGESDPEAKAPDESESEVDAPGGPSDPGGEPVGRPPASQAGNKTPDKEVEKGAGNKAPDKDAGKAPGKESDEETEKAAGKKPAKEVDEEVDVARAAAEGTLDQDDDVDYPAVGSLLAGADVLYPMLDRGDPFSFLHELAAVLLDDGILDADQASEHFEAQRGEGVPVPARQEAFISVRSGDNAVALEEVYRACEQEDEDQLADAGSARPLHDSDL